MLGFSSTFVLAACYGPPPRDFELDVFPGHLDFLADGEEAKTFQIMTEGRWSITQIPSFVSVSSTSGKGSASVQVRALPNHSTTSRTDMIVICGESDYSGSKSVYVTVTQERPIPRFSVSPLSLYFSSAAGMAQTLRVTSNTEWMITSVPNWLTVSPTLGQGNMDVTITTTDANMSSQIYSGEIVFLGMWGKSIVSVFQAYEGDR